MPAPKAWLSRPNGHFRRLVHPHHRIAQTLACIAFAFGASSLISSCGTPPATPAGAHSNAVVTSIVDGDTLDVLIGGRPERVRLLGIDAPESVDRQRPEQCYGKAASARLAELVPPGQAVLLVRDLDPRDRYGRLLAYVFVADSQTFVNHALVASGHADVLIYEPNTAYASNLRTARRAAQAGRVGLWGACDGPDQAVG